MKIYEKLADDWYTEPDKWRDIYGGSGDYYGLKDAYIAGFLKAREMAKETTVDYDGYEGYHISELLNKLGENEV